MAVPSDIRQRAIALIERLPIDQLTAIVQLLEVLSQPVQESMVSPEEANLLQIIQRRLPPEEQELLNDLRDLCEWGDLTDIEHARLISYEDALEQQNVERLEALIKLANLKKLDLITLNQQLKSQFSSLHAT